MVYTMKNTPSPSIYSFLSGFHTAPHLIESIWSRLSVIEKSDLLLNQRLSYHESIVSLASVDECDAIRMLAYSPRLITLHLLKGIEAAVNDKSLLVRAAAYANKNFDLALKSLNQEGRLIMIGLRRSGGATAILDFVKYGLSTNTLSTKDAADIFSAYSINPNLTADYTDSNRIRDGVDFFSVNSTFQAVWAYANEAPRDIADAISDKFPMGHQEIQEIPLESCTPNVLEALVWRGYKPLLEKINDNPNAFSKEVNKALLDSKAYRDKANA